MKAERAHLREPSGVQPHKVVFLVLPGFSSLEVSALREAFAMADTLVPSFRLDMHTLSPDGQPIESSSGLSFQTTALPNCVASREALVRDTQLLVICSGRDISPGSSRATTDLVRAAIRNRKVTCAMGGVIGCLAKQDLIAKGTDHWDRLLPLRERFPTKEFEDALMCRDGHVVTCAGQTAAIDLALLWIAGTLGEDIAKQVSNLLLVSDWRAPEQNQPCDAQSRYRGLPTHLTRVVQLMYDNIEEPLSLRQIATDVGLSGRQIERLSQRFIGCSPASLYRNIQLDRALRLLRQTDLEIVQISIICGFGSLSTFNKNFKKGFGRSPKQEREGHRSRFTEV